MRIASGTTDQYVYFVAVDATDFTTRETGFATWTVYRSRDGGAATQMTTPTINETDATNMPGVYELLLDEDMTVTAGNLTEAMTFHITHAGMAPVTIEVELFETSNYTVDLAADAVDATAIATGAIDADAIASDAITAAKIANGAIDAATFAAGAIDATAIATGAIDADALATDAVDEIVDAVWNEDATAHQTTGTFGQAIGDPVANSKSLYDALITDAVGASVTADVATVDGNVDLILADTGTDGVVVASINAGAITAAAIATGAVDADALATDAVDEIVDGVWDEVLNGATHNTSETAGRRLRLLNETGGYGGYIWIDTVNGSAGTTDYENGTDTLPVSTIADANTLAASLGIDRFKVAPGSTITFAATQANQVFDGEGWTLALGSQSIDGTTIIGATVSGVGTSTSGAQFFEGCVMNACTLPDNTTLRNCSLASTLTASGTTPSYFLDNCYSAVAGAGTPIFDINSVATTDISFRHYSGGIQFNNGAATTTVSLEGQGNAIIAATCTSLDLTIRGNFTLTDSGTTSVITDDARVDTLHVADQVWDELQSAHVTAGSFGEIATEIADILTDTADMQPKLGTPVADISADIATVDANVDLILADTGTDGVVVASINANAINAAAIATGAIDADSIATDAITAAKIAADAIGSSEFAQAAADKIWSTAARTLTANTNFNDPTAATIADAVWDELQSAHVTAGSFGEIATEIADILTDTAVIGAAGAGLTAIPWNASWDAEVESEVNDALDTAISELSQAAPTATPTIRTAVMLLYMALRNRTDVNTSGTPDVLNIYNDAGTVIAKKQLTDSGGDYSEAEMESGP